MRGLGLGLGLWGQQGGNGGGGAPFTQPANLHMIMGPGDSRTALGGGLSGTYGVTSTGISDPVATGNGTSIDGYLAAMLNNRIRQGSARNNGIGGQLGTSALNYPRWISAQQSFTGRIDNGTAGNAGTVLTITAIASGDLLQAGQLLTGTGISAGTHILAQVSGTTGGVGVYTVDVSQNVPSTGTINAYYLYGSGKTIADTAANEANIVSLWLGTNSSASAPNLVLDLAAMDNAINGLTNPSFTYPGYGGPLPLAGGVAKTLIIFNETRRGVTTTGTSNNQVTTATAAQWANYARTIKRYSYDSGDPVYANPHVIVVDTFDDPVLANLSDTTNFNPNPGYFADGLHPAAPAIYRMGQVAAARMAAVIPQTVAYAQLGDTTNVSTNLTTVSTVSNGPTFGASGTPTLGGTASLNSNTLSLAGVDKTATPGQAIPGGWVLQISGGSGTNVDLTYVPLTGVLGNELMVHITGTLSANTTYQFNGGTSPVLTGAQLATINLATDTIRLSCRTRLLITAGSVIQSAVALTLNGTTATNEFLTNQGYRGIAAGYSNNAAWPMTLNNAYANIGDDSYLTLTTKNVSLAGFATGAPTSINTNYILQLLAGTVDVTLRLSQFGVFKVTN